MSSFGYRIDLPEQPEAVVFVNGICARDLTGLLWLWKNMAWIKKTTVEAAGCVQVKAGLCGPNEVAVVSYWRSGECLREFFRGEAHRQMMQFTANHPESLCLYNETYQPSRSGKYTHEPQGMALIYNVVSDVRLTAK